MSIKIRQFILLALLSSVIFKLGMLPSMTATLVAKDCIFTIFLICFIDAILILMTLSIAKRGGLLAIFSKSQSVNVCNTGGEPKDNANKGDPDTQKPDVKLPAKILILAPLVALFSVKIIIYATEFINYISESLFDGVRWFILALAIMPVVFLIGKKKLYVLGRISQICLWIIAVAVIFNVIFNTFQLSIRNLLPLGTSGAGNILSSPFRFLWYVGDCLPLMFARIAPCESDMKTKSAFFAVFLFPVVVTAYYCVCVITYGNSLPLVYDIFSRVALFNSISDELGAFDLPFIASWLSMAALNLSLMSFGIRHSCRAIMNGSEFFYPIIMIALGVVLSFFIRNFGIIEHIFVFSPVAYFGGACLILITAVFIISIIKSKTSPPLINNTSTSPPPSADMRQDEVMPEQSGSSVLEGEK